MLCDTTQKSVTSGRKMGGKETQVPIERSWPLQQSKEAINITWDPAGSMVQNQELKAMIFEKTPQWYFSERLKRRILRFVVVKKFVNSFVNYLNEIKREKYSPCWLKILVALSTVNSACFFPHITTFLLATCLLLLHVMTINCALVRKQPPIPQSGWVIFKLCSTKWFQSASKSLWANSLKNSNKRVLFAPKTFMVTSVVQ